VCAKNREGEATNTLVLNVKELEKQLAPMVVKPLAATLCKVGDSVKLETVITGKPKPALQWTFNGKPLSPSADIIIAEKDDIYTLIIDNVKQAYDGDYTIKAENALGSVQTSANLNVEADKVIEFVKPLEDVEIKEKDVIEIDVELSTDEVPNVKWYKDGDAIDATDDKKYEIKRQGRKHSLVIKNATVHHEGEYTAAVGEQECSCELTVVELPPEFTKKARLLVHF
jgi:ribosomal protein L12E/L44/L45/RPP1/RPP2